MSTKGRIKIIKKGTEATRSQAPQPQKYGARRVEREMGATVSDWVAEIQTKKREEIGLTLDQLFGKSPAKSRA